jgi:hypothetical protein
MYDNTLKSVHFQKSLSVVVIRECFQPPASLFGYPQVFSAIRKYSPLSASILCYPQLNPPPSKKIPISNWRWGFSPYFVNCSSSVDPFNAVVEDVPPVITMDTWSK